VQPTQTVDYTLQALRNGNPYTIGNINESATFSAITSSSDYLYVGSVTPLQRLFFEIPTNSGLPSGDALSAQYWSGSSWSNLTVYDNTSDGQGFVAGGSSSGLISSGLSYSGEMYISQPSNWAKSQVASDPYQVYLNQINTGIATVNPNLPPLNDVFPTYPPSMSYNPTRYWMRFKATTVSSPLQIVGIQPLSPL